MKFEDEPYSWDFMVEVWSCHFTHEVFGWYLILIAAGKTLGLIHACLISKTARLEQKWTNTCINSVIK